MVSPSAIGSAHLQIAGGGDPEVLARDRAVVAGDLRIHLGVAGVHRARVARIPGAPEIGTGQPMIATGLTLTLGQGARSSYGRLEGAGPRDRMLETRRFMMGTGNSGFSEAGLRRMREVLARLVQSKKMPGLVTLISRGGHKHVEALGTMRH